jgi:L-rhamnose mutarotase
MMQFKEYKEQHDNIWPEVKDALRSVGLRNISLWAWENRLFYYAEYVGQDPFDVAMATYEKMPRIKEWEELMHTYQQKLPGQDASSDLWWQPCQQVYNQD